MKVRFRNGYCLLAPELKIRKPPIHFTSKAWRAPLTVNTMPEATLQALADHGKVDALPAKDMNDTARTLDDFVKAGVNLSALGAQLQEEGATSFVKSWNDLLNVISSKTASLQQAA